MEQFAAQILRLSAGGKTTREISAWLKEQGVSASHVTVAAWLKKNRTERTKIVQEVLAHDLPKQITADLETLNDIIDDAGKKASLIEASWSAAPVSVTPSEPALSGNLADWIKLKELQIKTVALKLSHAGALTPKDNAPGQVVPVVVLPQGVTFEQWDKLWAKAKK